MEVDNFFLHTLLLLIFYFSFSTSFDTIAINQTIKDGTFIISKENNFALGFFSPGNSNNRYLGIWYYKVSKQTVVWVANTNHPINDSSGVLSINQYGNLILYCNHNQNFPIWSTNVSLQVSDTYKAQLLDSGNLVLVQDSSKTIVWQSFDYPTDTHLPRMKIGLNRKTGVRQFLTSWRSADDPATGDYSVGFNPNGLPQAFVYKGTKPYWRSLPWPIQNYEDFRNISFVNNPDEISVIYSPVDFVIVRIVLDYSGLLKHQTWHESEGEWKEFWSAPKYQCESYGQCGTYSKCNPLQVNRRFECDCLPGYEPKSPRDWIILRDASSGCVKKRLQSSSMCMNEEGFVKVEHVKVPDASERVWLDMNTSPIDCEKECKRKCSCSAYAIIDVPGKKTGCLIWFGELIDTVDNVNEGTDIYVRVDAIELAEIKQNSNGFLGRKDILAILVSGWFVVILFAYLWHKKKKKRARNKWNKRLLDMDALATNEVGGSMSLQDIAFFSLKTILSATENFSPANKLGQGGFGLVYKGQLSNGHEIAVKRLSKNSSQGIEEFKNEVMLIAKLQHKNLVKILGCCIEGEEPMLIYEYLPNKSLDSFLFDETKSLILDWRKRFDIIVGIARGILYIHQDSRLRIIHRDIKTSNILLDAEMNPRISDFGLARIFEGDQIQGKTNRIAGTFGYMSPEYVVFGKFSVKSDVFSYGVILLEIITGKKNSDFFQDESSLSLIEYVWELWKEDRTMEIVDSSLMESSPCSNEVLRCIQIGLLCVQEMAVNRPTMLEVVLMLNSETTLPSPNQPAFVIRKQSNNFNNTVREELCSANEVTISKVTSR